MSTLDQNKACIFLPIHFRWQNDMHQLVEALLLKAPEILWRGFPQVVYGGYKSPTEHAEQGQCPGSPAGV